MREFFTYGSVRGAARKGRSLPRLAGSTEQRARSWKIKGEPYEKDNHCFWRYRSSRFASPWEEKNE